MTGTRGLGHVYLLGSVLLLAASLHPSTAYSAPGDPPRGSPAGAVYELPLEQGRGDAAPKTGAGGDSGGGASQGGGEGSVYRTENNFGSSSYVPGAAGAGAAGAAGGSQEGGEGGAGAAGGAGSDGGDSGGGGGSDEGGGGETSADQVADTGNTSVAANVALLGAIALLAGGVAVASRRFLQQH